MRHEATRDEAQEGEYPLSWLGHAASAPRASLHAGVLLEQAHTPHLR